MKQIRSQFDAGKTGALAAPTPSCCCCCCCVVTIATSSAIAAGASYALSEQAGASAGRRRSFSAASAATVLVGFALFALTGVPGIRISQTVGLIAAALIAGAALYLALSELWRAQGAAARIRYPLAGLTVGTLLVGTPLEVMGVLALGGLTASIGPVGWAVTILYFALAIGLSAAAGLEARRQVAEGIRS